MDAYEHVPPPASPAAYETAPGASAEPMAIAPRTPAGLLDVLAVGAGSARAEGPDRADWIFEPASLEAALGYYRRRTAATPRCRDDLVGLLSRDIAELDALISAQVNAVLHRPRFQQLEAAWRGLLHLVQTAAEGEGARVALLDLRKDELAADLHGALEFDQSEFFRKVYESEFGVAGGWPFGTIVADYTFENTPGDVDLLGKIAGVAAAAFAPVVAAASPRMFGIAEFGQIERIGNLAEQFNSLKFVKWNALRDGEDSRFVGLTLPRVLMRLPYDDESVREDGFVFREDATAADRSGYLWGSAAFALGGVILRAFLRSGWFTDIRGTASGPGAGGVVAGLPSASFGTDRPGVAVQGCVEAIVGEFREKELSDLGFIALCDCEDTPYAAFFANQSIQRPKAYDDELATTNARMSAMLQYMLCASRFAHYLKVIARNQVGRFSDVRSLQNQLHSWIQQYVAADPGASASLRAKFPLRDAKVELREHPGRPGHLLATFHLSPHLQLDELTASVKLVSDFRRE